MERQHILIANSIDDGVGMQSFTKHLSGCHQVCLSCYIGIIREDGRSCEAKDIVLLELLRNGCMHLAKLTTMTLVEYHHYMLVVHIHIFVTLHKYGKLLDCGNDNMTGWIIQLSFQYGHISVAICGIFLEIVILSHGLIVQVLTVHYKQHLIYIWEFAGQ